MHMSDEMPNILLLCKMGQEASQKFKVTGLNHYWNVLVCIEIEFTGINMVHTCSCCVQLESQLLLILYPLQCVFHRVLWFYLVHMNTCLILNTITLMGSKGLGHYTTLSNPSGYSGFASGNMNQMIQINIQLKIAPLTWQTLWQLPSVFSGYQTLKHQSSGWDSLLHI